MEGSSPTSCLCLLTCHSPCLAGAADVRLPDPLGVGVGTLATQQLRAAAELDAVRGDWDTVASQLADAAAAADAPHWAAGGYAWALLQQGSPEVRIDTN